MSEQTVEEVLDEVISLDLSDSTRERYLKEAITALDAIYRDKYLGKTSVNTADDLKKKDILDRYVEGLGVKQSIHELDEIYRAEYVDMLSKNKRVFEQLWWSGWHREDKDISVDKALSDVRKAMGE